MSKSTRARTSSPRPSTRISPRSWSAPRPEPRGQMLPAIHDTGTGESVLFLHAFPLDASQWDPQVAGLSSDLRCVRVDLWGCGASPPPPAGEPTLDGFATAVLAALDSRDIDRVAVGGLSMGGSLAFSLWRLAPERISALVLCNTRGDRGCSL